MKTLAALLVAVSLSGCVIHWPPGHERVDENKRGTPTVVVCIFSNCKDIARPPPTTPGSAAKQ
jgi:hypothetical protein